MSENSYYTPGRGKIVPRNVMYLNNQTTKILTTGSWSLSCSATNV